jgi:hypothetical protein
MAAENAKSDMQIVMGTVLTLIGVLLVLTMWRPLAAVGILMAIAGGYLSFSNGIKDAGYAAIGAGVLGIIAIIADPFAVGG